jgi:hypothetical protein
MAIPLDQARHDHRLPAQRGPASRPSGSPQCPQCQWLAEIDHAEWNQIVRGETEVQSVDRHSNELLQKLRVAQTGVQILFAFLLGLAFTPASPTSPSPSRPSISSSWCCRRARRRC